MYTYDYMYVSARVCVVITVLDGQVGRQVGGCSSNRCRSSLSPRLLPVYYTRVLTPIAASPAQLSSAICAPLFYIVGLKEITFLLHTTPSELLSLLSSFTSSRQFIHYIDHSRIYFVVDVAKVILVISRIILSFTYISPRNLNISLNIDQQKLCRSVPGSVQVPSN